MPGNQNFFGTTWQEVGSKAPMTGRGMVVDEDYAKTMGLEIKEEDFFLKIFLLIHFLWC
jgi:hypothetical protein